MTAIFDAHLHVFDPAFPTVANAGYAPPAFTAADYRAAVASLGVVGGAVVAASTQGVDPAPLLAAARALGPGFVVVAEADPGRDDDALRALAAAGVRGLRFNLHRGGGWPIETLLTHAARAHAVAGLHAEIYADAATLAPHAERLAALPALALDHLGLTAAGLDVTCALAAAGVRVKATGFGRVEFDVPAALEQIAAAHPGALMLGTDLPSTRARRPFEAADLALAERVLGPDLAARARRGNAADFYRII